MNQNLKVGSFQSNNNLKVCIKHCRSDFSSTKYQIIFLCTEKQVYTHDINWQPNWSIKFITCNTRQSKHWETNIYSLWGLKAKEFYQLFYSISQKLSCIHPSKNYFFEV